MRADAKGATREAKRGARVTFLDRGWRFHALSESRDYSTSTLASHADFRYCYYNDSSFTILKEISYIKYTLYYVADVRFKAQNNGQQVAGHDDRPNIFQPGQTPILAGQINEYYNFFLPDGISNYAGSRSLCGIVVQVLACARLSDNIVRTY